MSRSEGSARAEAERLVATVLAMAAQAARDTGRQSRSGGDLGPLGEAVLGAVGRAGAGHRAEAGGWATGTPECCVCPVCRVISGLRDPDPHVAERLATGAGDFAAGVASLLRSFSDAAARSTTASPGPPAPDAPGRAGAESSGSAPAGSSPAGPGAAGGTPDAWRAATTAAAEARPAATRGPATDREPAAGRGPDTDAGGEPVADAETGTEPAVGIDPPAAPAPPAGADPWSAATRTGQPPRHRPAGAAPMARKAVRPRAGGAGADDRGAGPGDEA